MSIFIRKDKQFNFQLYALFQCKNVDIFYFRDPGYEYPPEPELFFEKYKRNENDDDVENGDDDDDDEDFRDSKNNNNNKTNWRKNETGAAFHMKTGTEMGSMQNFHYAKHIE